MGCESSENTTGNGGIWVGRIAIGRIDECVSSADEASNSVSEASSAEALLVPSTLGSDGVVARDIPKPEMSPTDSSITSGFKEAPMDGNVSDDGSAIRLSGCLRTVDRSAGSRRDITGTGMAPTAAGTGSPIRINAGVARWMATAGSPTFPCGPASPSITTGADAGASAGT
jgi:hypothetical protein